MWRLLTVAQFAAACLVGAFLLTAMPSKANAQSCTITTYTGCAPCANSSGSIQWCWQHESTPYPYAYNAYGLCQATTALPGMTETSPADPPGQRNVFRFYIDSRTDHFLTLNWCEVNRDYYERIAFTVLVSPADANYQLIYRCRVSSQDHFVSTDPNCEGTVNEGSYGYVSTIPRTGYVPIHRFYKNSQSDHLTTKDYQEGVDWGAAYEGVQGYVPN